MHPALCDKHWRVRFAPASPPREPPSGAPLHHRTFHSIQQRDVQGLLTAGRPRSTTRPGAGAARHYEDRLLLPSLIPILRSGFYSLEIKSYFLCFLFLCFSIILNGVAKKSNSSRSRFCK